MKSETFKGKDESDLEKQLWDWRSANPKAFVQKKHPIKTLAIDLAPPSASKMLGSDLVSMQIDYDELGEQRPANRASGII